MGGRMCLARWAAGRILIVFTIAPFEIPSADHIGIDGEEWPELCVNGNAQSPVDIDIGKVVVHNFPPLLFSNYDVYGTVTGGNNGHTEILQGFTDWVQQPTLGGGGLRWVYELRQFHLHWDQLDSAGSEHSVNKLHYALEAHFVHVRENLTMEQAQNTSHGIAVLAVFFAVSDSPSQLRPLEELFNLTNAVGSESFISYRPDLLLPEDRDAWFRYEGSLTSAPCSEVVVWTALAEPIYVEERQLDELRHHASSTGGMLVVNRRPVQPLNGRTIYMRVKDYDTAPHLTCSLLPLVVIMHTA